MKPQDKTMIDSVTCGLSTVARQAANTSSNTPRVEQEGHGEAAPMSEAPSSPYTTGGRINFAFLAEFRLSRGRAKVARILDTIITGRVGGRL
jgi:hypothetical protein